jgi:hypothetical protein
MGRGLFREHRRSAGAKNQGDIAEKTSARPRTITQRTRSPLARMRELKPHDAVIEERGEIPATALEAIRRGNIGAGHLLDHEAVAQ